MILEKWYNILHYSQKQAFRPVLQEINFLASQAEKPVPKRLIDNGAKGEQHLSCN